MSPNEFIAKWKNVELTESAAAQSQFIDLCRLLDEPTPAEADPKGTWYAFEKGALKTGGGDGWADVWKRGCFAWEYKGRGKNLDAAFAQLQRYAIALENPPLLIVSDMERFRIHTNWTNTIQKVYDIPIEELADDRRRRILKWAFSETEVEQLKPDKTRQELTEEVAAGFAKLAQRLRERGYEPEVVAHFVNRLVFCMFAEDVGLLPHKMFTRMLEASVSKLDDFEVHSGQLFAAMQKGGPVGFEHVEWFNGGLFDDDRTLPLQENDIRQTLEVARLDWSNIDPSIMGTLFERGLDPDKRSQLGAHYTDRDKIMLIVNPAIVEPMTHEWEETKAKIEALMERHRTHSAKGEKTKAYNEAQALHRAFIEKLKNFRVLDPACGSGNFLYLSLLSLKDLEHHANLDAEMLGLPREFPGVGPQCVKGIEINPFAAELARVSVWIGEIQWMKRNGFDAARNPILKPLETIECRDALLNPDGTEAEWPKADVIVGNPPFLGDRKLIDGLGEDLSEALRSRFQGRVPRGADLVCYWFEKSRGALLKGNAHRFGLVATNSIRGGKNRVVLNRIAEAVTIFEAWSNEPWIVEGAAVRVSLICVQTERGKSTKLDGRLVSKINTDLTGGDLDLTKAQALRANRDVCLHGSKKIGSFDIDGDLARFFLQQPLNPNGRPNSDVIFPVWNGADVTGRLGDRWIIDFGMSMKEAEAALYELPFDHVVRFVKPERLQNRNPELVKKWWMHGGPRPAMRNALAHLSRCIGTPATAKHRIFVWVEKPILPDAQLMVTLRDDETTFGILHSHFHELWALRMGTSLEDRPRYTPTTCFETFPLPEGLTPDIPAADFTNDPRAMAIAEGARKLNELREAWLTPEDLVDRLPEVVPGYADRIVPKDDKAAVILKKRTLTNLYNERPAWLDHAHRTLDEAVAAAYGWPVDLSDDEILERLFKLNQERATGQLLD
ncbi:MAG: class I SAM-dependent DNA methyltransferase [Methyloceanibacter sp.]